jgi:hypothetical protein
MGNQKKARFGGCLHSLQNRIHRSKSGHLRLAWFFHPDVAAGSDGRCHRCGVIGAESQGKAAPWVSEFQARRERQRAAGRSYFAMFDSVYAIDGVSVCAIPDHNREIDGKGALDTLGIQIEQLEVDPFALLDRVDRGVSLSLPAPFLSLVVGHCLHVPRMRCAGVQLSSRESSAMRLWLHHPPSR